MDSGTAADEHLDVPELLAILAPAEDNAMKTQNYYDTRNRPVYGYKQYTPIWLTRYNLMFPWNPFLNGNPGAWWTENNPAPSDDCINKSPIQPGRIEYLKQLLPPYSGGHQ
jgi:hypothetical protein